MGFRTGAYAKIWEVKQERPWCVDLRLSISRKDKKTDSYVTDFSGFVQAMGKDNIAAAAALKEGDRIKLGNVDVTSRYDAETKKTYTNFKLFSFEMADGRPAPVPAASASATTPALLQDGGGADDGGDDCPF